MENKSITPQPPADFTPTLGEYKPLQPFRFWCQKVLPLVYDDSLSYYELLCKVVDYLNKTMEDVDTLNNDVVSIHGSYVQLQNYVNNYFASLDVQAEINNKLDSMAQDGTLTNLIKKYVDPLISVQDSKITVLENRMDTFVKLPDGSTTGDAELTDIRVPASGFNSNKPYATAGDSVRGQVTEIMGTLSDANVFSNLRSKVSWVNGSFISNTGWPIELSGFSRTNPIKINSGTLIKFKAQGYEKNLSMISQYKFGKYIPLAVSRSNTVEEYEYTTTEDGEFVFSCATNRMTYLKGISVIDKLIRAITTDEIKGNKEVETSVDIKWNNGTYIAYNGAIVELAGYSYSDIIELPPKAKLTFNGQGYENKVSMMSQYKGGRYIPLVVSKSSELQTYEYTTDSPINVVLSGTNINASNAFISLNIYDSVVELSSKMEELKTGSDDDYVSLSVFPKFGVIGDSFASGEVYDASGNPYDKYEISWGQILARKLGTNCVNYSEGGLTTRTWLTASKGLSLLNSTPPQDIYYLVLGINDTLMLGSSYLGSVADIENSADTFYGNYGKIINAIKAHAPNAKIMMFTTALNYGSADKFNNAIIEIANHFSIPYGVQLSEEFFNSNFYLQNQVAGHPIAIVYSGMANAFERIIKKNIVNNVAYFKYLYAHN